MIYLLLKKVEKLSNNTEINNYYLNVGDLLFQYHDKKKNPKTIQKNNIDENKIIDKKYLYIFLIIMISKDIKEINEDNNDNDNEWNDEINDEEDDKDELTNDDNDYYKGNMKYLTKSNIMNKYLTFTDENYVLNSINNQNYGKCKNCKKEMLILFSEGIILCKDCGIQEEILINSDKPSYKEPPKEMSYFCITKRINHFNEWLNFNLSKRIY